MNRRRLLVAFAMTPIAAALAACRKEGNRPEGMVEMKWDRDTCVRCNMLISDQRFAAQMRGGERNIAFKFDDVGCMVFWLRDKLPQYPWMADASTRMWVGEAAGQGHAGWIDPRSAHFLGGHLSPMGYNHAAYAAFQPGAINFPTMRERVLALGK